MLSKLHYVHLEWRTFKNMSLGDFGTIIRMQKLGLCCAPLVAHHLNAASYYAYQTAV
jgi:hypothetical protein